MNENQCVIMVVHFERLYDGFGSSFEMIHMLLRTIYLSCSIAEQASIPGDQST